MAIRRSGLGQALVDIVGALTPLSLRNLQAEVEERIAKLPNRINEFGYDAYGLSPEWLRRLVLPTVLLYRYYFRCETFDIERVPPGRVMLVGNHSGQLPFDGMMLTAALVLEAEPPRIARPMAEYFVSRLPWLSTVATRGGAMAGTPANCIHMLENEECVMVFPEGARGTNKPFSKRYQLQRFGLGFMRLALETTTPIVPVGIVGAEEQQPGLVNFERVGRMLGLPALPITLGFPWLGPFGLLPMPVKYRLYFGSPMHLQGDPTDEDAEIEAQVELVKRAISELLGRGCRERKGIFT